MIYLFSKSGLRLLESMCFTPSLFAFDFDGTLSKIVKNPNEATINESTLQLIDHLGNLAPVAIVSGRGLKDLKTKFNPSPGFLIGNHGLEGLYPDSNQLNNFQSVSEKWKRLLRRHLMINGKLMDGIEIEDKIYSIAVHYRKSRSKKRAKLKIIDCAKKLSPTARIILGKSVVNLVPQDAPHKGIAVRELMIRAKTKSSLYVGDDDTDEDVFSLADPHIFTIRIGMKKTSQAKFYLKRQSEINRLLKKIIQFHCSKKNKKNSRTHLDKK
jgi:trehalose 6-phosphate phosphatase